jgi:hypothetical protein
MDRETIQVNIGDRYANFRSTRVKPFIRDHHLPKETPQINEPVAKAQNNKESLPDDEQLQPQQSQRNRQPEPRQSQQNLQLEPQRNPQIEAFLTEKENRDQELSLELRAKGIITTPSRPFIFSYRKEIDGLLAQGIYEVIWQDAEELRGVRIFSSQIVDEVKGKETSTPYKKS